MMTQMKLTKSSLLIFFFHGIVNHGHRLIYMFKVDTYECDMEENRM